MRHKGRYGIVALLLCALSRMTLAQTECDVGVRFKPSTLAPVSLQVHDMRIGVLFRMLEALTGTPFRVPRELSFTVTYDMRNLPACQVLRIIAESQSLSYRQDGDTILVVPPAPDPTAPSTASKQE